MRGSIIPGVRTGRLVRHGDERGSFREVWRESWYRKPPSDATAPTVPRFVQANVSTSAAGVLRGLHMHRRQVDHWVVLDGRAFVALVDIRPALAGRGGPVVATLEAAVDDWLAIPIGVAHGFLALEPLTLLYMVSAEFDDSDELGFAWDDPTAAVAWPAAPGTPDGRPILSERDLTAPRLPDLLEQMKG